VAEEQKEQMLLKKRVWMMLQAAGKANHSASITFHAFVLTLRKDSSTSRSSSSIDLDRQRNSASRSVSHHNNSSTVSVQPKIYV
jgi:hypothetical protein